MLGGGAASSLNYPQLGASAILFIRAVSLHSHSRPNACTPSFTLQLSSLCVIWPFSPRFFCGPIARHNGDTETACSQLPLFAFTPHPFPEMTSRLMLGNAR